LFHQSPHTTNYEIWLQELGKIFSDLRHGIPCERPEWWRVAIRNSPFLLEASRFPSEPAKRFLQLTGRALMPARECRVHAPPVSPIFTSDFLRSL
jgi:hypothetical protein